MIQVTDFGTSLTFKDDAGQTVVVSFTDGARFSVANQILNDQNAALNDNAHNLNLYMDSITKYNLAISEGRTPGTGVPVKPKLVIITDTGKRTEQDYSPALPDPIHLVIAPSANSIVTQGTPLVLDAYQTALMGAVLAMGRMIAELQAALKTKGVI